MKEGKSLFPVIEEGLMKWFRGKDFNILSDLERLNLTLQTRRAEEVFKDIEVEAKLSSTLSGNDLISPSITSKLFPGRPLINKKTNLAF
ncbi:MAG: hypothetical protein MPF33_04865 [Candidatus Aramenus sp.]|nr:hypothetical protein [Candidatus Aramenus sp.]